MSLWDRLKVAQASVQELLQGHDDPEQLLQQAIVELQRELDQARERLDETRAMARGRTEMLDARKQEAERFEERAAAAESDWRPQAAAEARGFKQKALQHAETLEREAREAHRAVEDLENAMAGLQKTIDETTAKRAEVRARLDELRQRAGPRVESGRRSAGATPGQEPPPPREERRRAVESELDDLQRKAAVDEKLAELKKKMKSQG